MVWEWGANANVNCAGIAFMFSAYSAIPVQNPNSHLTTLRVTNEDRGRLKFELYHERERISVYKIPTSSVRADHLILGELSG